MKITWVPQVLRNAGIKVVETDGWLDRSHGELSDKVAVIWHHDASPPGDSPGALDWMLSNWDEASAQCWVDRYGTWYMVGCGVAWHAGQVLPGMPNNFTSIGIETDHTVDESWPDAQLNSLRAGTAAILRYQGLDANYLNFHKVICSPPGRKQDPYGLEILPERLKMTELLNGTPSKPSEDEVALTDEDVNKVVLALMDYEVTGNDTTGTPVVTTLRKALVTITSISRGNSRMGARMKRIAVKMGLGNK